MTCVFIPQDGQDNSKDVEYGMKNSTTENSTDWTSSERKDKAKRDTEKASPKDEGLINYFGVAFLFLPWIIPRPVNQIIQRILLHYINYLSFFTLFYCWRWLTEKLPELPDLKKKAPEYTRTEGKVEICRIPHL
ncbi:hypothetical protein OIU78_026862 [Salix suchowensis]|nr:hypothetical protein OIU78_026862 [Salix suchowensis]